MTLIFNFVFPLLLAIMGIAVLLTTRWGQRYLIFAWNNWGFIVLIDAGIYLVFFWVIFFITEVFLKKDIKGPIITYFIVLTILYPILLINSLRKINKSKSINFDNFPKGRPVLIRLVIILWIGLMTSFYVAKFFSEKGANFFAVFSIGFLITYLALNLIGLKNYRKK